ncbi:hypothetical protein MNBD_PLANCTO02-2375 [hydrothermal vent metagenome]|uniref:ABC-2 family transporter protein n=1 Tax=hydrothermal vent metagenome TaxID=652676 RepID=A0A3B1E0E3_9ZZZZ
MSHAAEVETNKTTLAKKTFWDKIAIWSEWASDYGNAILVKETRQALKSKQFVITFMLVLIACWIISFFGVTLKGGNRIQYGETAKMFFLSYYIVLTAAVLVIVPFTAFRSLLQERELMTFDLLSITALKPRQIILGKLASALLQTLIYFSAIAPFIAFTSFLGGFDFAMTVFMLSLAFLLSIFYCTITLMVAAFIKNRIYQALLTIPILLGLIFQEFSIFGFLSASMNQGTSFFKDAEFWWGVSFALLVFVSYSILFLQIATTQLTFASSNRSTAIRITCFVQFLLFWGSFIAVILYARSSFGVSGLSGVVLAAMTILPAIHLFVVGLFATTEPNFLSRRIRRDLPKLMSVRTLSVPFMPGGSRGFIYIVSQVIFMGVISSGLWKLFGAGRGHEVFQFILLLCSYLIIFFSFSTLLSRWGEKISGDLRPGHIRALALVALAGCSIIPAFVFLFYEIIGGSPQRFSLIDGISPFYTLTYALDPTSSHSQLSNTISMLCTFIPIFAVIGILFNLRPALNSINEILFTKLKSTSRHQTN